jgi:hypothetical protein
MFYTAKLLKICEISKLFGGISGHKWQEVSISGFGCGKVLQECGKFSKFAMQLRYIAVSKGTKARNVPADKRKTIYQPIKQNKEVWQKKTLHF